MALGVMVIVGEDVVVGDGVLVLLGVSDGWFAINGNRMPTVGVCVGVSVFVGVAVVVGVVVFVGGVVTVAVVVGVGVRVPVGVAVGVDEAPSGAAETRLPGWLFRTIKAKTTAKMPRIT